MSKIREMEKDSLIEDIEINRVRNVSKRISLRILGDCLPTGTSPCPFFVTLSHKIKKKNTLN